MKREGSGKRKMKKIRYVQAILLAVLMVFGGNRICLAETTGSYTDRELIIATQIAYYGFTQQQLENHGGSASVRELLRETDTRKRLQDKWDSAERELDKTMAKGDIDLYEEIMEPDSRYGSWIVADICDRNQETGFYGMLLDTGNGCGLIAFRGSESTDTNQLIKDWLNADFGLLMDRDTRQQTEAAQYLTDLQSRFGYGAYVLTGHSLGGNLAEHAAITASDEMRLKLVQTVNFDGPGFSKTYLERHQAEIEKTKSSLILYRWSLVGALLTHPSCTDNQVVQVTAEIQPFEKLEANYLRHSTAFLEYEGEGLKRGNEDLTSAAIGVWSRTIDEEIIRKREEYRKQQSGL